MKLTVYQSDKGDCLLLSSSDSKHMLVDGGMAKSFNSHTAQHLSDTVDELERICVTHIDQDHIHGVLELCDHILDWRVFDFQRATGNGTFPEPDDPRPPAVKAFWHNAFAEQFGDNADNLANSAGLLSSVFSTNSKLASQDIAETLMGLVFSQRQGFDLSQRIGDGLLNIPVNTEFDGELILAKDALPSFSLGATNIHIIGPFEEDIAKLRKEWTKWVESASGVKAVAKIKKSIDDDAGGLQSSAQSLQLALNEAFADVELAIANAAQELGLRKNVTTPNLASIMFVAEEAGKTILFTGDGHWADIDKGVALIDGFEPEEGVHFDTIKVPHHGSEHNSNLDFWRRMTADNYVFCSDGSHHNPDVEILEKIIQSRDEDSGSAKPHANQPYTLWFNTSSSVTRDSNVEYVKKLEKLVMNAADDDDRIGFAFLESSFFEI